MDILLGLFSVIATVFLLWIVYSAGKERGRAEAQEEKALEVIPFGKKNIVLISEEYFNLEQAQQIGKALKQNKPIIYKPKKK